MTMVKILARLCAITFLIAASGCLPAAPAGPIGQAKVPPNADLSGVRAVSVSLTADKTALPFPVALPDLPNLPQLLGAGSVDLVRPDGKIVYSGKIVATQPLAVKVTIPTKDATLTAVLHPANGADKSAAMTISSGAASARFQ